MKKIASLLLTLSLVFCVLFALPLNASAASTETQDGLEVTITTDKTEYTADEDIQVSVNIKNNNSYKVEDVSIETLLPEGLVLKTGNLSATDIDIEAGASYSAAFVAKLSEDLKDSSEGDQETNSPPTGDNLSVVLWVVLLIASVIGIFLTFKFKKTAKMMSLFLCFAMVLTMLPMSAFAAENSTTITVDKTITVDGKEYTITSTVSASKGIDNSGSENLQTLPEEIKDALGLAKDTDDTDSDGLTDYEELIIVGTDPTKYDTDNNGINDANDDADTDGLSNIEEVRLGT